MHKCISCSSASWNFWELFILSWNQFSECKTLGLFRTLQFSAYYYYCIFDQIIGRKLSKLYIPFTSWTTEEMNLWKTTATGMFVSWQTTADGDETTTEAELTTTVSRQTSTTDGDSSTSVTDEVTTVTDPQTQTSKGKGRSTCYRRLVNSSSLQSWKLTTDWHELTVPRRIMRPSIMDDPLPVIADS